VTIQRARQADSANW